MGKFIPALKMALVVCIAFLAGVIALGAAAGAERPFQPIFPLMMGLIAFGLLSTFNWVMPNCPACGTKQPAQRRPSSFRQLMWGGWTCANCGAEMDRHGKAIER
jgi:hypothetical protein